MPHWLADKQTEMRRGDWHDPDAGKVAFGPYAVAWIRERELTSTTRQLYGSLLKHHLEPVLGAVNLAEISPPLVRSWGADKLRWGELIGLHRRDVDLEHGTVRVRRAVAELSNGQREMKAPKSAAGKRTVSIPGVILPDINDHLKQYAGAGADGRVFIGAKGGATPRRNHFNRLWQKACREAGIKGLHFHDLRHTGNTLAASTGASTRELMARMGHSTARAALIYQHASADRDRLIADALSELVKKGTRGTSKGKGHAGDTTP
ncbi:tyrosine-type recombinase/integrase [Streptomyces sp. NPDC056224]|uniref:tyrosine-type recombinase/integrase n=1 Tax=Streptomyces sp. NPDC056224 TaxID=3345750 RepID=UPI0035DC1DAD